MTYRTHRGHRVAAQSANRPAADPAVSIVSTASAASVAPAGAGILRDRQSILAALTVMAVLATGAATVLVATPQAGAANDTACHRWVSTGGSDANDGSSTRPVRSLNKLVASLAPGQVGCIAAGTTYHSVEGNGIIRSGGGTSSAPVIITTGGSGRAKVYGQIDAQPSTHDLVFTNLDFVGTQTDGAGNPLLPRANTINLRGDRLTLRGNSITNPFGICINAGTMDAYNHNETGEPADDLVITNNVIFGCGMSSKLTWTPEMSGAHGVYLVWTRRAVVSENLIVNNRYRGFQSWPRSEGTIVANNLFDANATHVNLGSALREGYRWHTSNTVVRDNILVHRTNWVPEKNQAGVVGNFPTGATYGNVVKGNCIDPAGTTHAGNGFVYGNNEVGVATFVNRAAGDYRLRPESPCRGKGPRAIQPGVAASTTTTAPPSTTTPPTTTTVAPPTTVSPAAQRSVRIAQGACRPGRVEVSLPASVTGRAAGEWVFHRADLYRWTGAQWTRVEPVSSWRYGWVNQQGTVALDQRSAHWVTYDEARVASPAAGGIDFTATSTGGGWYAVHHTVWFTDGQTFQGWTNFAGTQGNRQYCLA